MTARGFEFFRFSLTEAGALTTMSATKSLLASCLSIADCLLFLFFLSEVANEFLSEASLTSLQNCFAVCCWKELLLGISSSHRARISGCSSWRTSSHWNIVKTCKNTLKDQRGSTKVLATTVYCVLEHFHISRWCKWLQMYRVLAFWPLLSWLKWSFWYNDPGSCGIWSQDRRSLRRR